jgi:hypothetical protein
VYASYAKEQFDLNPKIILNETVSASIYSMQFEYENIWRNGYLVPMISVISSDFKNVQSKIQVFVPNTNSSQDYTLINDFSMDLSISGVGYLKNMQNSTSKLYYILYTPIEIEAVARLFLTPSSF